MENDILLARSGVRWLVGVCGFRFSSKIFKLRISKGYSFVCGESGERGNCGRMWHSRVPAATRKSFNLVHVNFTYVHNVTE